MSDFEVLERPTRAIYTFQQYSSCFFIFSCNLSTMVLALIIIEMNSCN